MPLELITLLEVEHLPAFDSDKGAEELLRIQNQLTHERYWSILRWMWIRHGGSVARLRVQHTLLMADRPCKNFLMTKQEHTALAELAEELDIYQGTLVGAEHFRWSWSLVAEISREFARK